MSVGHKHTCAVTTSDELWCWGQGEFYETGLDTRERQLVPTQVGTDLWRSVTASAFHSCGIQVDGSLWCWGTDVGGNVGLGPNFVDGHPAPVQVGIETDWATVDAKFFLSCGTRTGGTLWCWGNFGNGPPVVDIPTQVGTDSDWTLVSAGQTDACAIKTDHTLWCWGRNLYGQVGDGTTEPRPLPIQVGLGEQWFSIDVGVYASEALSLPN